MEEDPYVRYIQIKDLGNEYPKAIKIKNFIKITQSSLAYLMT